MTVVLSASFSGATGVNLTTYVPETGGGSFSKHPNFGGNAFVSTANRLYMLADSNVATYFHSYSTLPADIDVTVDVNVISGSATTSGIIARCDTTASSYYLFRYNGSGNWELFKNVAGTSSLLGSYTQALTVGQTYVLKATLRGTALKLLVDGVQRISVTDASLAGTTSTTNRVGFRNGTAATNTTGTHLDNWSVDDLAVVDTLGLTDVANHRIFQRTSGSRTLSLAGTYGGQVPASIEARTIKQADATQVQGWTTLTGATISGGAWAGSFAVTAGPDMLIVQTRSKTSGGVVIATANGANQFGVGDVFHLLGSSTVENWILSGTGTLSVSARVLLSGTWSALSAGSGGIAFANAYGASSGCVVGFVRSGVGGTRLRAAFPGWAESSNANFLAAVTAYGTAGGVCAVLAAVGVNDASDSAIASEAAHLAEHRALISNFRSASVGVNVATLPWVVLPSNRRTSTNDPFFDRCRAAEMQLAGDANVYVCASVLDLSLNADGVHLSNAAYATQGARVAAAAAVAILASGTSHLGPVCAFARYTDATRTAIDVTLAHGRGSDFTPVSAITGWTIADGGTPPAISAATRQAANKIRLALSAAPTGTAVITYQGGTNPNVSAPVVDNSELTLPLAPTPGTYALTVGTFSIATLSSGMGLGMRLGLK